MWDARAPSLRKQLGQEAMLRALKLPGPEAKPLATSQPDRQRLSCQAGANLTVARALAASMACCSAGHGKSLAGPAVEE